MIICLKIISGSQQIVHVKSLERVCYNLMLIYSVRILCLLQRFLKCFYILHSILTVFIQTNFLVTCSIRTLLLAKHLGGQSSGLDGINLSVGDRKRFTFSDDCVSDKEEGGSIVKFENPSSRTDVQIRIFLLLSRNIE